jgi:hypothetical protein
MREVTPRSQYSFMLEEWNPVRKRQTNFIILWAWGSPAPYPNHCLQRIIKQTLLSGIIYFPPVLKKTPGVSWKEHVPFLYLNIRLTPTQLGQIGKAILKIFFNADGRQR